MLETKLEMNYELTEVRSQNSEYRRQKNQYLAMQGSAMFNLLKHTGKI